MDFTKDFDLETAKAITSVVKTAMKRYAAQTQKKNRRMNVNKNVKNFYLDSDIAEKFLNLYSFDETAYTKLDDGSDKYCFSRATFYKSIINHLTSKDIRSHRKFFYEFLSGNKEGVLNMYNLFYPDCLNGLITNLSLHVYMSDLSRKPYHDFIAEIYREYNAVGDNETNENYMKRNTFVLKTLLATMEIYYNHNFAINGKEYTLKTLPPYLISYLTKTPLDTSVVSTRMLNKSLDNSIIDRFSGKFNKLLSKCHLMAIVDTQTMDVDYLNNYTSPSLIDFTYNKTTNTFHYNLKNTSSVILTGFRLGTINSFKTTLESKNHEFQIPIDASHLFVSCKRDCICNQRGEVENQGEKIELQIESPVIQNDFELIDPITGKAEGKVFDITQK